MDEMGGYHAEICHASDGEGGFCTLIQGHCVDHRFFNWGRFLEAPIYVPPSRILALRNAIEVIEARAAFGREWVWFSRERWEALKGAAESLAPGLGQKLVQSGEEVLATLGVEARDE